MQRSPKTFAVLCILMGLLTLLSACGKKDETVIPMSFPFEEESLPALAAIGAEDSGVLVETIFPEDAETTLDEDGNEVPTVDPISYVYNELENSGVSVEKYVALLTGPDYEFGIVNAAGKSVPPPDYTQEEGFVVLSRGNISTQAMLRVTVIWELNACTINLYRVDALPARTDPSEPRREISPTGEVVTADPAAAAAEGGKSAEEVVRFFENISPSALGLPGETMAQYNVYYMDGKVLINGESCGRVRIYEISYPEESNHFMGTFLISADSGRIYKHDAENDAMIELTK